MSPASGVSLTVMGAEVALADKYVYAVPSGVVVSIPVSSSTEYLVDSQVCDNPLAQVIANVAEEGVPLDSKT